MKDKKSGRNIVLDRDVPILQFPLVYVEIGREDR